MDKLIGIILMLCVSQALGQDLERKNTYYGNKAYDEKEFDKAIEYYESALLANPLSYKTNYNMANAYFKKGDFQKASELFGSIVDLAPTAYDRSLVYHNLGNSHFMNQKLDDAIDAYKETLKLNPRDEDARYNLAYALLLKQQQPQQDQNQDQQDQNENQDQQDQNSNPNENQDQQEQQDQNNEQNNDQNNDQKQNQSAEKKETRISKEQAKRILDDALKKEKEVQKKREKYKKVGSGESSKKDW